MIRILFFIFFVFCFWNVSGQNNNNPENVKKIEISADLIGYKYFPELEGFINNKYSLVAPNGLKLSFQKNKFIHYLGINYFKFNKRKNSEGPDDFYGLAKYKALNFYYGLYYTYDFIKFQFNFGADLYNSFSNYTANFEGGFDGNGIKINENYFKIGIRPSLILKYQISDKFSLFFKTSEIIEYVKPKIGHDKKLIHYFDIVNSFGLSYTIQKS